MRAKIFTCHSVADPFAEEWVVKHYISAMERAGLDWLMIIYGCAKHSLTNLDANQAGMEALKYSKSADQRFSGHMEMFLRKYSGKNDL